MKKIGLVLLAFLCFAMTGCVTGSHVLTGTARPASLPEQIAIYPSLPKNAEIIGSVTVVNPNGFSHFWGNGEMEKMKYEAAKMGANGLVVGDSEIHWMRYAQVSATAIYVPESK
jgi:hypothetical protein